MSGVGWGGENSVQRLEKAQKGMAEKSWPQKPGDRVSPLSGKMKETARISPRFYGQEKEFPTRQLGEWQKESRLGAQARWEGGGGRIWEEARWNQQRPWSKGEEKHEKFQPASIQAAEGREPDREIEKVAAPGWSSRNARLAVHRERGLRRYEGRLTRVRSQVWEEGEGQRELGPARRERFRPEEVEKILSQPVGEFRPGATEQSQKASPLAAADN